MADYVQVLATLKGGILPEGSEASPVIAFGGSYGGMLAAWLRAKYPGTFAGAIAASAPILGFPGLPFYETNDQEAGASYWDVVAYDMTEAAGVAPSAVACGPALKDAFALVTERSATAPGRALLEESFGLCPGVLAADDDADGARLSERVLLAYDDYAMGNYPFPSTYIVTGDSPLPPFPMREACALLTNFSTATADDDPDAADAARLAAAGASVNLLYNASGDVACFDELPPKDDEGEDGIWDVQWCTELMCQETYFTRRPPPEGSPLPDVWPPYAFDWDWIKARCSANLNLTPRPHWISQSYYGAAAGAASGLASFSSSSSSLSLARRPGPASLLPPGTLPHGSGFSRIAFSNGEYDPWRAAGVTANDTAREIVSLTVAQGAHHLDLMFASPYDPPELQAQREAEVALARAWAAEWAREWEKAAALRARE